MGARRAEHAEQSEKHQIFGCQFKPEKEEERDEENCGEEILEESDDKARILLGEFPVEKSQNGKKYA